MGCDKSLQEMCLDFMAAFDDGKWKDDDSFDKTRGQIYAELCALAATIEGVDAEAVAAALKLTGPGNAGTGVTQAIKWAVKYHRCRGIHVTPTVLVTASRRASSRRAGPRRSGRRGSSQWAPTTGRARSSADARGPARRRSVCAGESACT